LPIQHALVHAKVPRVITLLDEENQGQDPPGTGAYDDVLQDLGALVLQLSFLGVGIAIWPHSDSAPYPAVGVSGGCASVAEEAS
jgi:hypothetical protein